MPTRYTRKGPKHLKKGNSTSGLKMDYLYLEAMKILGLHLFSFSRKSILNFLFFFFIFVSVVHSKNQCSTSFCGDGSFDIKYPFQLPAQQLENCEYINLKCVNEGITILNLPYSGEFYVQDIYYGTKTIQVYDPSNCLPRRLLNLNLSSSLLMAREYQNYTFYSCPQDLLGSQFKVIDCLSNSTSATIATSFAPRELMERVYNCKIMFTSSLPVSWPGQLDHWGTDSNLQLLWNDISCKHCEDGSRSKLSKVLALAVSMPGIVIISTFCCIASCMQLFNLVRDKYEIFGTRAPPQTNMFPGIVLPQATMFPGAPPQTTSSVPIGLNDSKIKSCTELVVVNEGQSISGSETESNACPICLEGYHPEVTVRCISVCKHGFHANCIEQWLRKNGTCPVCRTLLSDDAQVVVQDIVITTHIS